MDPKKKLAALEAEADALRNKLLDHEDQFTEADSARVDVITREYRDTEGIIARKDAAANALGQFGGATQDYSGHETDEGAGGGLPDPSGRRTGKAMQVPGSDETVFTKNAMDAFRAASGTIGGIFAQKALIPSGAVVARFDQAVVNDPANSFSLYGAVQHLDAGGTNSGSYLRQTARTNAATTVTDGALKPISVYGLEQKTWRLATVAHVSEAMQRQWFEDYTGLQKFLNQEMAYGIDLKIADMILNGGTDETGAAFTGIMNTSGIGQTAFLTSKLRTIRKAVTDLQVTGAVPKNIVLHPSDWEEIESLLTADGGYILQGAPQLAATPTLFGLPVLLSISLPAGSAIVGDLASVVVIDRGDLMLAWTEGGQMNMGTVAVPVNVELFRANKLVWRAEMRLGLQVMSTKLLRVADLVL
ncbi:phage major capsid protein [Paeniglutamicibacter sp.]|uniref:phage major capsid protein n=1 Tax=Paeniglutamicibacter sp. TaxID=1934391 RepID=UPI003988B897